MSSSLIASILVTLAIVFGAYQLGSSSGYDKGFKEAKTESEQVINRHLDTITRLSNEINQISQESVKALEERQSKIKELNNQINTIRSNHKQELSLLYTDLNNLRANANVKTYLDSPIPDDVIRLLNIPARNANGLGIKINTDTNTNTSMQ